MPSYQTLSSRTNLLITVHRLLGELASAAVQQSPYTVPYKLAEAIEGFKAALPEWNEKMARFDTMGDLQQLIIDTIGKVPEIVAWNTPNIDTGAAFNMVSRFSQPRPEYDFIDLDAMARNIAMECWKDAIEFEDFNRDFEAKYARPGTENAAISHTTGRDGPIAAT